MKKIYLSIFFLFGAMAWALPQVSASQVSDAQAIFIYNFSRLVKWPANATQGNFVIGVLSSNETYNSLTSYTSSKKVGTQKIIIKQFNKPEDITNCNILFVGSSKSSKMDQINEILKGTNTLIIGEHRGITESGAAINFVIVGDRLKFELNKSNIDKYNLIISKSLQDMAYKN
jgi:hypothetical protein